jgi:RNA polymerase sigma-70 factor (ECF subfamily)
MSGDQTTELEGLLLRVQQGDPSARKEFINRVYSRLHRLVGKLLGESFPRLKGPPALQNTSDVTNAAALRLYQALEEFQPATLKDFFRWAACRVRGILLDLAKKPSLPLEKDLPPPGQEPPWPAAAADSEGLPRPEVRALHEQVERLPEEEQEVVNLLYYAGLSEAEAAAVLKVSAKTVRRRWLRARLRLEEALRAAVPGWEGLSGGKEGEG